MVFPTCLVTDYLITAKTGIIISYFFLLVERSCTNSAGMTVDKLMGRHLQVFGRQASLLHGRGAKSDSVVVGKQDIGPAGTLEDSVGRTTLTF